MEQPGLLMMRRWILVVEPNEVFRDIVCDEASYCLTKVDLVCVSYATELLTAMTARGSLPQLLIVDWFASGSQVRHCLEGLRKHGILGKLNVIALAGESARRALCEAQELGVRRFICKHPDEIAFRKKIAEAIHEFVMQESRVASLDTTSLPIPDPERLRQGF
ncbi:MAG: hypothetical protein ACHQ50_00175 [Fimbriimonadales bacterium]